MATQHARFHHVAAPQLVMLANAALFIVGAVLHLGIPMGPLEEPRIVAASVAEMVCAIALTGGALMPLYALRARVIAAAVGNVIALSGVALGVIALALGAGPRTLSNDIAHALMTALALGSLWLLFTERTPRGR